MKSLCWPTVAHLRRAPVLAVLLGLLAGIGPASADPLPQNPFPAPPPRVFCFRVTDIEADASVPDRFQVSFEVLNWSDQSAHGVYIWAGDGTLALDGAPPSIVGASIDPDGRGGPPGGNEIGPGIYNSPSHQSGRGRGDLPGMRNEWSMLFRGPTSVYWADLSGAQGVPFRHLMGAGSSAAQYALVPGVGYDGLLQPDSAVDGGPGPYTAPPGGQPFAGGGVPMPPGSGNVLDGFVIQVDDFQPGEVLSFNWMLTDVNGDSIGTIGTSGNVIGDEMGFGVFNLMRIQPGQAMGAGLYAGNSGFSQSSKFFYGDVYRLPSSALPGAPLVAEFGAEFGASIIVPPLNPDVADEVPADLPVAVPNVDPDVLPPNGGVLPCPNGIPGDLDGNGVVSIVDMQCLILVNLWDLAGKFGPLPPCLVQPLDAADLNCSGSVTVVDVQLGANFVLNLKLNPSLDANANGCLDTCDCTAVKCDDGNACTMESCNALAQCTYQPISCNDGDACTLDSCEPATGCTTADVGCLGAPGCARSDGDACDDGDACTHDDACAAGLCAGVATGCDDANPCTVDACDPASGCTHVAKADGTECGDPSHVCIVGLCQVVDIGCQVDADCGLLAGSGLPNACETWKCQTLAAAGFSKVCAKTATVDCDDGNVCTDNTCDPATGCVATPVASAEPVPCDDGDVCSGPDLCEQGACVAVDSGCNDGNPCSLDFCDSGTSCFAQAIDEGACDDGDACTTDTTCQLGHCLGAPVDCDDNDLCTIDSCSPDSGCHAAAVDCDDANPCTTDSCDAQLGCQHTPTASMGANECDDGDVCTVDDHCDAGLCVGGGPILCFGAECPPGCVATSYTVPYSEDFDGAASFGDVAWSAVVSPEGADSHWGLAPVGGTGAGLRPTWSITWWDGTLLGIESPGYQSAIASPLLDATEFADLTFSFDVALDTALGDAVQVEALVSDDAGASWESVWSRQSAPATGTERVHVDVSELAGGSSQVRLAFRVSGVDDWSFTAVQFDEVSLLPGRPPHLDEISALIIAAGSVSTAPLAATNADSVGSELTFVLDGAPPFVSLVDHGNGTAELQLEPSAADMGIFTFDVRVTDGVFDDRAAVSLLVGPPGSGGSTSALSAVIIRDQPGGNGSIVGALDVPAGAPIALYAAGYNQNLEFIGDANAIWVATGSLAPVPAGPSSSVAFTAGPAGAVGRIRATHPLPTVVGDETGLITVAPADEPGLVLGSAALSASKPTLIAGGVDTLHVRLTLLGDDGAPYAGAATVAFQTTAGALSGAVIEGPIGVYRQVLTAPATPTTLVVTATLDGQAVAGSLSIPVISPSNLTPNGGSVVFDCTAYAAVAGQDIVVDGGTLEMDSSGCAPMHFGHVVLRNSAVLTHPAGTAQSTPYIDIEVASLSVDATSAIDVSGKGYPAKLSWASLGAPGTNALGACSSCGGSHGGRGGRTSYGANAGAAYDLVHAPAFPGGGGWGAAGGGLVRVRVTDPQGGIALDGNLLANGAFSNSGGGAGGGVWLHTPVLSGAGQVAVNGANGQPCCGYASGAGGGGRVAVVGLAQKAAATALASGSRLTARGGTGWDNGGAGTVFVQAGSQAYGTLVVDNGGTSCQADSTVLPALPDGALELLDGDSFTDADGPNWMPNRWAGLLVAPNANQGDVTLTDNALFRIVSHDAHTATLVPLVAGLSPEDVAAEGDSFRTTYVFDNLEVRGSASLRTAADLLVWSGDLASGDATTLALAGSITAGTLELTGVEDVLVADGALRVERLLSHEVEDYPLHWALDDATLVLHRWSAAVASASGSTVEADEVAVVGDLMLLDTVLTLGADVLDVGDHLSLDGESVIRPVATGSGPVRSAQVSAGSAWIGPLARIDASGLGWPAGVGFGGGSSLAAKSNSGGSHGGLGGLGSGNQTSGVSYDDPRDPQRPGGGAGGGAGVGGGVLRLQIDGTLTVNGAIRANGVYGTQGGGAGGSVRLDAATLTGTGTIEARGGNGETCCGYGAAAGGGGRVAIYATAFGGSFGLPALIAAVNTQGGSGWRHGGAGTTFVQRPNQAYGDLIVDNRGLDAGANALTPLVSVPIGTIDGLTPTSWTDLGASYLTDGRLAGLYVVPQSAEGSPNTLADDIAVPVASAAAQTLVFSGAQDLTQLAAVGDSYRSLHTFDNLEVRGAARLATSGDLLVLAGDLSSLDTSTFQSTGWIACDRLDLHEVTALRVVGGGLSVQRVMSQDLATPNLLFSLEKSTSAVGLLAGQELYLDGGTAQVGSAYLLADMTLTGAAQMQITADAVEAAGNVLITGASALRHSATTASSVRRLHVQAADIEVQAGSVIDASGLGFPATIGFDGTTTHAAKSNSGGSHGGLGARGSGNLTAGYTYGDLRAPTMPGAGAGGGAGIGGGVVHLEASGTVRVDGALRANGSYGTSGGGAGGSVWVETSTLTGNGTIEAKGGAGETCCGYGAAAGGGGRVALYYEELAEGFALSAVADHATAGGGSGWRNGAAGTVFLRSPMQLYGDLLLDNESLDTTDAYTPLHWLQPGIVDSVAAGSVSDVDAGWVAGLHRHTAIHLLDPTGAPAGDPASLADDPVWTVTDNSASLLSVSGATSISLSATAGSSYRGIDRFDNLEVRGKARLRTPGDLLVRLGDLKSADDTTFAYSGEIMAKVLDLGAAQAVLASSAQLDVAQLQAGGVLDPALPLSLVSADWKLPVLRASELAVQGGQLAVGTLEVTGSATLAGAAKLEVTEDLLQVGAHLHVADTASITHPAAANGTVESLTVQAGQLTVDAGASIDASGRGWPAGVGFGAGTAYGAKSNSGGSYGGLGGLGSGNQSSGIAYGDLRAPGLPGAGPGGGAGRGGGAVRLDITGTATINGAVRANGTYGTVGGGAGGSVWISAQTLAGQGMVEAKGGAGETCCGYGAAAGGGGRIAVYAGNLTGGFGPLSLFDHVHAGGGTGWRNAGAGTVFVKRPGQAWGDLLVDNKNVNAAEDTTPLVELGQGVAESWSATSFGDLQANWVPHLYVGTAVNPAPTQGDPNTLTDDVVAIVSDNGATVMSLDQDVSALYQPGAAYRSLWTFDNLEIRGLGRLRTQGDLLVLYGDIGSANETSLALRGSLRAHTLDINEVDTFVATDSALELTRLIGAGADSPAISYSFSGSTATLPSLDADVLSVHGGSLTVEQAQVWTDATLSGAAVLEVRNESLSVGGLLTLAGTSVLRHPAAVAGGPKRLHVVAGDVGIDAGASIDVSGLGWPAGIGADGTAATSAKGNSGGSHGGLGGKGSGNQTSGLVYEPVDWPTQPGAGAGGAAGKGGGVVWLEVAGELRVDGEIRANGAYGTIGGGAGGSVLIQCSVLTGNGAIQVKGGAGEACCGYGAAGGGGGRIAVYYDATDGGFALNTAGSRLRASGGAGWRNAGAGTVFLRSTAQTFGELWVDNAGIAPAALSTPLVLLGTGTWNSVTPDSLGVAGAGWRQDAFAGTSVVPKMQDATPGTLTDNPRFAIVGNSAVELQVDGDPSLVASVGDAFTGVLVLDSMELSGNAQVSTDGAILVLQGDRHSPAGLFDVPTGCALSASIVELHSIPSESQTGTISTTSGLLCPNCP